MQAFFKKSTGSKKPLETVASKPVDLPKKEKSPIKFGFEDDLEDQHQKIDENTC